MRKLQKNSWWLTGVVLLAGCPAGPGNGGGDGSDDDLSATEVLVGVGFSEATRAGRATGLQEVAICDGWFPLQSNHLLDIREGLALTVRVSGDTEPRLWILCGESNFCGTLVGENISELSRFWNRGTCEVFAGTPEENGQLDYTLEFVAN